MAFSVADKRVVVVGAGTSGRAAAELLASRGAHVTLADVRTSIPDDDGRLAAGGVALVAGPHRPELFASADLLVVSPGVPLGQPAIEAARRAGVPVIGEIELASRWLRGRVVAITGTKGKSTTTTLAARMLREGGLEVTAGGNLGTALSAQVALSRNDAVHVVEVSSFQLQSIDTFHPWIAVLVNLSPDHLDHHASFEEYAAAKARIFRNQTTDDWAVVNAEDAGSCALAEGGLARRFDFALDAPVANGVTVEAGEIVRREAGATVGQLMPVSSVRLPGRHLLADVLAACAVAHITGVAPTAMRRAVEGFAGLEHALELVDEIHGVRFVNDSKATNIAAARRALESFDHAPGGIVAIMGGRFKGGAFEDLRGVVLLAPACSSFDMFENYAARGRAFKDAVAWIRTAGGRLQA